MCKGFSKKRMVISLLLAGFFGFFCAYGTSMVEIPGFEMTLPYLATVFYARLLIGVLIGFMERVEFVKSKKLNPVVRGAFAGLVVTPAIALFGGFEILMGAGAVYGIITDVIATRFS